MKTDILAYKSNDSYPITLIDIEGTLWRVEEIWKDKDSDQVSFYWCNRLVGNSDFKQIMILPHEVKEVIVVK